MVESYLLEGGEGPLLELSYPSYPYDTESHAG